MNQNDDHGKTIDALNEMVGSGMKQLAISQPFASVQERKALLPVVEDRERYARRTFFVISGGCQMNTNA